MRPIRICFVSLYSYALFNLKAKLVFGGSEVRAALFAKGVAADPRFDVSMIVRNHDNKRLEQFDNIHIWRHSCYRSVQNPLDYFKTAVRTILHRCADFPFFRIRRLDLKSVIALVRTVLPCLGFVFLRFLRSRGLRAVTINGERVDAEKLAIYRDVDADVYCVFGASEVSAELVGYCNAHGRKVVLLCGSACDLLPIYSSRSDERNIYGCRAAWCNHALVRADLIVTQTQTQARLLLERFGRDSIIIQNPIDLFDAVRARRTRRFALWIGKSDNVKRPELALELARRVPDVKMILVMNRSLEDKFLQMIAEKPPNVTIIERVPIDRIERLMAQALVLVNTSDFEGFPNTFLQAGKYSVPVLSLTVDPDRFLETHSCGIVAHGSMDNLCAGLRRLADDTPERERIGSCIRSYVERYHDLTCNINQLIDVLASCVTQSQAEGKIPPMVPSDRIAS